MGWDGMDCAELGWAVVFWAVLAWALLCSAALTGAVPGCVTAQSCCSHCQGCPDRGCHPAGPALVPQSGKDWFCEEEPAQPSLHPECIHVQEGIVLPSTPWHLILQQLGMEGTLDLNSFHLPALGRDICCTRSSLLCSPCWQSPV